MKAYRLSRNFQNYPSDEVMPKWELILKSAVALLLGIIPFGLTNLWLICFRACAKREVAMLGYCFAALMMGSAKLFGLTQTLVWGHYVKKPIGDKVNTRLAQYGMSPHMNQDLKTIWNAFFAPQKLSKGQWTMREWSQVKI